MIAQNAGISKHKSTNSAELQSMNGECLKCGAQLSFCGKAFTADLKCPACGAINVYEESQQPKRLLDAQQQ